MCTQTAVPKYAPKHRSSSEMKCQRQEENGEKNKKNKVLSKQYAVIARQGRKNFYFQRRHKIF